MFYVSCIFLLQCADALGIPEECTAGEEGDAQTVTRTSVYSGTGIPITVTSTLSTFSESLDFGSLSGDYNGIPLKIGYVQQRLPVSSEVVSNLAGRSWRIAYLLVQILRFGMKSRILITDTMAVWPSSELCSS